MPVPLNAIVKGEPGALLAITMLPLELPLEVGTKLAMNVELCPALIVWDEGKPLMLKPDPEMPAEETVTLAVPVLVSRMVCVPVPPT